MSDTAAGLRRKIDSAGDLQSVVRTMKAMAASSIGQYERSVRAQADYYRTVELGLSVCFRGAGSAASMTAQPRQPAAGAASACCPWTTTGAAGWPGFPGPRETCPRSLAAAAQPCGR